LYIFFWARLVLARSAGETGDDSIPPPLKIEMREPRLRTPYDRTSIMQYYFAPWMVKNDTSRVVMLAIISSRFLFAFFMVLPVAIGGNPPICESFKFA
jgi:hypothetical protein